MILRQYLEQLTPSTLKKMIEENGFKEKGSSPNELVDMIDKGIFATEYISKVYQDLTKEEKGVLDYFILHNPNQILPYRRLEKIRGPLSRDQFEYGLAKLRRKGIIFTLRRSWGEMAYVIPENLYLKWHRFYFNKAVKAIHPFDEYKVKGQLEDVGSIEEDLYTLLTYIQLEEVPITQKGTIHKRHIAKLNEAVRLSEQRMSHFPLKQRLKKHEYPKNIGFLLEIAIFLELVESFDFFKPTNRADWWHNLDQVSKREYLEAYVRLHTLSTDIVIQHFLYVLFHLEEEKWYSIDKILVEIARVIGRPLGDEFVSRAMNEFIYPLHAFGWLNIASNDQEQMLVKWKAKSQQSVEQIYIQPNFELLVPQSFPHRLRVIIDHFAELAQKDQLSKYIITKDSILRALEKGYQIDEFLKLIEEYSVTPLHENVKKILLDWADSYGAVSFSDVRMMECKSEEIATLLKGDPTFKKWIIGSITPTKYIVKKQGFEELLTTITKMGFIPKKEIWTEEEMNLEVIDELEEVEIFRTKEYRIENIFPHLVKNFF